LSHQRQRNVRRIGIFATAGGLICAGAVVAGAFASQSSDTASTNAATLASKDPAALAAQLVSQLGTDDTAGAWLGDDGKAVVAVTDQDAAAAVQAAGATAKMVARSSDVLATATAALKAAPTVAGTAWSVDPKTNQVVVLADTTVSSADWNTLSTTASAQSGAVRMERTASTFTTRAAIAGGDAIFSDVARCSLGFNVTDGTSNFILTAGHCGAVGTPWAADQNGEATLGSTVKDTFPGDGDFSLIATDGTAIEQPSEVDLGNTTQAIAVAAEAVVGEAVVRSGSTTGVHDGEVQALNATVNYPEGTVTGLIQTNVCAEPGDSGGPLFDGDKAIGLTSGGDGDCTVGGTTFFQPVTTALAALGVDIPAADGATATATDSAAVTDPPADGVTDAPTDGVTEAPTDGATATDTATATDLPTDEATATEEPTDEATATEEPPADVAPGYMYDHSSRHHRSSN
jgi:hypothetical protein